MALGEQAVQGMSELVEGGGDVVYAHVFIEIAHIHDNWTHFPALRIDVLVADIVHPRAASLAAAREEVGGEYSHKGAVVVGELPGGDAVRVVGRNVFQLLDIYAVEHLGCGEYTFEHVFGLEVFADLLFIEVVLGAAHLLCVVPPVPLLDFRAFRELAGLDVLVHEGLQVLEFQLCLCDCGVHYSLKEMVHRLRSCGHFVGKGEGCGALVAEDVGFAGPEGEEFLDELAVVVFVAVVTAETVGFVVLTTELTVFGGGHP